jgi:hypothetical protein
METNGDAYSTDTATDTRRVRHLYRLTVAQAAERLGITQDAVRQRIRRDTIRYEKDDDGRVYVYLDTTHTDHDAVHDTVRDELVEELRDRVRALEEANRENRRIIAALTSRIPQLEAPRDEPQAPETPATEPERTDTPDRGAEAQEATERRSWWRRFFGIE